MKQPNRYFFSQTNRWGACVLFASVALDLGCAKIAGIDDDVPVNPNSSNGSALCPEYCDTVMAGCPDCEVGTAGCVAPAYVYASRDMCMGVCHQLELAGKTGSSNDQSGDTINCRLYYARQAKSTGETGTCPQSGPGGSGICGSNCEAYCVLLKYTCPVQFLDPSLFNNDLSNCIKQCASIPVSDAGFNADQQGGNTLNCRLYHVSAANANADAPIVHCPHAAGVPGKTPCVDPVP